MKMYINLALFIYRFLSSCSVSSDIGYLLVMNFPVWYALYIIYLYLYIYIYIHAYCKYMYVYCRWWLIRNIYKHGIIYILYICSGIYIQHIPLSPANMSNYLMKLSKLKEILHYAMAENIKLQYCITQKMKFSIKDFFRKCDQIRSFWFFVQCEILDCV